MHIAPCLRRIVPWILAGLPWVAANGFPFAGGMLTNSEGYTLYTFDYDELNKSNCNLNCLDAWRPLRATVSDRPSGRLSIVVRANGEYQWALDARPLYLYARDKRPGDVLGENPGWAWHAVRAYPRPGLLDPPVTRASRSP
jgi:predicted lipoprotein with Yx(FWY)xxD motif